MRRCISSNLSTSAGAGCRIRPLLALGAPEPSIVLRLEARSHMGDGFVPVAAESQSQGMCQVHLRVRDREAHVLNAFQDMS